jgi:gas vesicle protein
MLKAIIGTIALALAAPAFAESDTKKDVDNSVRNTVDDAKDKLHTDSGTAKAKRHAKKAARNTKTKARHTKNDVKNSTEKAKNDATK